MKITTFITLFLVLLAPFFTYADFEFAKQKRVLAIGDLHGDYDVFLTLLKNAKVIDSELNWSGADTYVVQVGDVLSKGSEELAIIKLIQKLEVQAEKAGGAFIALNGNHELYNVDLNFKSVTKKGYLDFEKFAAPYANGLPSDFPKDVKKFLYETDAYKHGRVFAFMPGGPMAKYLATHNSVLKIGETIFVHGGVEPEYALKGLEKLNRDISEWMDGSGRKRKYIFNVDAPLWSRLYSDDKEFDEMTSCESLEESLKILGAKRMVVAHSPQPHINSACNDKVWRIDTGMSKAINGGGELGLIEIIYDDLVKIHKFD